MDEAQIPKFIIHFIKLRNMHYLLNKDLSLESKGLMALLLHLHEGGVKLTDETIKRYCALTDTEVVRLLLPISILRYIKISDGGDETYIFSIREDNEIKE